MAVNRVSTVLTLEGRPDAVPFAGTSQRYSSLSDVMIGLTTDTAASPPTRELRVVKARGLSHPLGARPFHIEAGGLRITGPEANRDRH